jgi:hypothetical protein
MATEKVVCRECEWKGTTYELLHAPNPFSAEEQVMGCPQCFSVESMDSACEREGCWKLYSCGTPTLGGYAQTCGQHVPTSDKP